MLGFLQRIGKALMLPIAVLPAAGLLLRLGQEDLLNIPFMAAAGDAVFANLPLLFAIGVAIGLAKDNNGAAGLAGAIGFFILNEGAQTINPDIDMSFLGGLIIGVVAGLLYNRYHDIQLPDWLGFFSGRRFVPIITALVTILLAFIAGYAWPPVQAGIDALGQGIIDLGAAGAGVYGFLNRLLIPVGLHHVLNSFVWFEFGSFNGATGDLHRFFAGDPTAGVYMGGFFPIMMFGLPAACLAMILAAKRHRRKATAGMLGGLALTSFLTGITEPIEFSFMFLSPLLYGVHAVLTATSMFVVNTLGILHGFTFSAGAFDFFLNFGIATQPLLLAIIGLIYAAIYFVVFYFLIVKLGLKTPGREDDDEDEELATQEGHSKDDKYEARSESYIEALGGKENIAQLDNCVTRLRLKMDDMSKVDEAALKKAGARGVMKLNSTDLQVIVGTDVEFLASAMKKKL
ncbi:N-acetylglucosamine-specific PTS transporter subunit IIBC [Alteribacter populi]|uniref:N-acetylglucosamine-specific PTS transporter subunit IIBC n=1 Tax=Alteribacter populi TaxID=2011011 RepID=UPI000BBB3608|nr:N-acetylglucosamine-specific PTS transporter subunit IIBC [Alteribacter populi]